MRVLRSGKFITENSQQFLDLHGIVNSSKFFRHPGEVQIKLIPLRKMANSYFSISKAAAFRFSYNLSLSARTQAAVRGAQSFSDILVVRNEG